MPLGPELFGDVARFGKEINRDVRVATRDLPDRNQQHPDQHRGRNAHRRLRFRQRTYALASSCLQWCERHFGERGRERAAILAKARRVAKALLTRLRLIDGHDPADAPGLRPHDNHSCREEHGLIDGMSDEHGGELALPPQPHEIGIETIAGELVERSELLAPSKTIVLGDETARNGNPHLHAAGQLPRIMAGKALGPYARTRLAHTLAAPRFADAPHTQ